MIMKIFYFRNNFLYEIWLIKNCITNFEDELWTEYSILVVIILYVKVLSVLFTYYLSK